jgi:predicted Rossmann fold nucleotide-binding protein DprA/Smf involved in DNA uptake
VLGRLPCGRARLARNAELPLDPLAALVGPGEALEVDELVSRSGLETAVVLVRLLELEIAGVLRRTAGGRFVRCRRNVLP